MITLKEAQIQQKKAEKRLAIIILSTFMFLTAVCVFLSFINAQSFYISLYLSLFVLLYVCYKAKITEFIRPKQYKGEITYFNVRTEQIKEIHSHQAGAKYTTYTIFVADMIVKDEKGKTRHKTFRYTKDYDNVKPGDHATVLRFVDKPVIEFKK